MKKITGICAMLICLLLPMCLSFAQEDLNISSAQSEAISLLNDLGIFSGVALEDAQNPVTRAEFAKAAAKAAGAENLSPSPRRIYTDVLPDNDAAASIEYLYDRGIMTGYGNGEFKPDEPITVGGVIKVMVSVLGYSNWAENQGGYPAGYFSLAVSNSLISGIKGGSDAQVTVGDAAVIIQNTLESRRFIVINGYKDGFPVEEEITDKMYMSYALDLYRYIGVVEAYENTSLESPAAEYKDTACKIGGEMFEKGSEDISNYLGLKVKAYYKSEDGEYNLVHLTQDDNNKVVEVKDEDILKTTTKKIFNYYYNNKTKSVNIDENAVFIYNGKKLDAATDQDLLTENGFVRLIDNDADGKYDVVIIKEYETFVVDKVVSTDQILNFKYDAGSLGLGEKSKIKSKYYMDGEETEFSSISSGSVVSVAISRNTQGDTLAEVYISNNKVTGRAVDIFTDKGERGVTLEDGSRYIFTKDYERRLSEGQQNTYEPMMDNDGTFYIDSFNKLEAYTVVKTGKNYAYVVKCYYDENEEKGSIRLFTKEGNFETLDFSENIKVNGRKVAKSDVVGLLKQSGEDGTVNQLIIYKSSDSGLLTSIETAEDKSQEKYYIASEDKFVMNAQMQSGVRFYKNMADKYPFSFVDGQSIQFMIPGDRKDEKAYKIASKLSSTDVSLPAPIRIYDAGAAGSIGAITTNTANEGSYNTPVIIDSISYALDDDGEVCTCLNFIGGTSILAGDNVIYNQPNTNWSSRVNYSDVKIEDLKRGDVVEYTTSNNKLEMIRVLVRVDDIGPVRIDGDDLQRNGNTVAKVISMSENGRTALVYYYDRSGNERYQTLLINGTVYRYDSSDGKVYNSSTADICEGDTVLINAFWWSPKLVVIFR
ncbi:MAG: S-layer homology domain-containing protein [Clostridiales bacterium]|nr:S-layer homology domain-containing protein [Clostridiales bacterium]